jgi:hypothetical protein
LLLALKKSNDIKITLQEQQIISAYRELADSDKRIVDFVLVTSENDMSKAILKLQFLKTIPHNAPFSSFHYNITFRSPCQYS